MTVLGLSSKREVTRTSIRVRTAMAVQVREQGRYLGGRPPYGYRLGDGGPHPNKAHAAWGRRARRLEPDPETAHFVRWIFAQRLAGHSAAQIARALNEAGVPCRQHPTRDGTRTAQARAGRWARSPRSCGIRGIRAVRCGTGSGPTATWSTRVISPWDIGRCSGGTCRTGGLSPVSRRTLRWSARPASWPPRTSAPPAARRPEVISPGRETTLPAGRAADMRHVRAADGIGVGERQARLPVPPWPYHRLGTRPGPAQERLCPRGPHRAAPARPPPAAHRARQGTAQAAHPPRNRHPAPVHCRGPDHLPARSSSSPSPTTRPQAPCTQAPATPPRPSP